MRINDNIDTREQCIESLYLSYPKPGLYNPESCVFTQKRFHILFQFCSHLNRFQGFAKRDIGYLPHDNIFVFDRRLPCLYARSRFKIDNHFRPFFTP